MSDEEENYSDYCDYDEDVDDCPDDISFDEGDTSVVDAPSVRPMDPGDVAKELKEQLNTITAVLDMTTSVACKVMQHFKWDVERIEQFLEDPEGLLNKLGVSQGQEKSFVTVDPTTKFTCSLCLDDFPDADGATAYCLRRCGHKACGDCWKYLLEQAIKEGRKCTSLTCPMGELTGKLGLAGCRTIIEDDMFQSMVSKTMLPRYETFVLTSFVDNHPSYKWCPGPGCEKIVFCADKTAKVVECYCGMKLCFQCGNECHAPASCKQMDEWKKREQGESDNLAYITANTKPCPTCQVPVERTDGCNHMHCPGCKAAGKKDDWCWGCGKPWDEKVHAHNWYNCPYQNDTAVKASTKEAAAKASELYKYVSFYEKYARHESTRKFCITKDLQRAQTHRDRLVQNNPGCDAEYIIRAVKSLVDARTLMKFAYVFAYYLPEAQQQFFEFQIVEAETALTNFANMLEDLWRHDEKEESKVEPPPISKDVVMDTSSLLSSKLGNVLSGVAQLEAQLTPG